MGRVYWSEPWGDDHEGWLAVILPDGTDTGTYSNETPPAVGHRPACECDWRGTDNYDHPGQHFLDEADEDALMVEWEAHIAGVWAEVAIADKLQKVRFHAYGLQRVAREAREAGIGWDEIVRAMPWQFGRVVRVSVEPGWTGEDAGQDPDPDANLT